MTTDCKTVLVFGAVLEVGNVFDCPSPLADWDEDRTAVLCALVEAMDQMPKRDEFVRLLRSVCVQFEDGVIEVINVPEVPDVPDVARSRWSSGSQRRHVNEDWWYVAQPPSKWDSGDSQ